MEQKKQLQADLMLVLVTLCWGVSYFFIDICLEEIDPFTLNAFRFLGAFFVIAVFSWNKIKTVNRTTLRYSVLLGIALVFVYIGATFGVKYTTISNSGFLCALTVIFTPLIARVVLKQKQSRKLIFAVIVCLAGIALLTLKEDFSINMDHIRGDMLCIMCAFIYAIDLLLTEKAVTDEKVNAFQLGVFQLGVTGVLNLVLALIIEEPHFPATPDVWGAMIFLSLFCTGVAYIVQPIAQQYTTASHTGIIYALEPVFSAIVAVLFANEILSFKSYIGAALMLLSIFIMEVDLKSLIKKKKE